MGPSPPPMGPPPWPPPRKRKKRPPRRSSGTPTFATVSTSWPASATGAATSKGTPLDRRSWTTSDVCDDRSWTSWRAPSLSTATRPDESDANVAFSTAPDLTWSRSSDAAQRWASAARAPVAVNAAAPAASAAGRARRGARDMATDDPREARRGALILSARASASLLRNARATRTAFIVRRESIDEAPRAQASRSQLELKRLRKRAKADLGWACWARCRRDGPQRACGAARLTR